MASVAFAQSSTTRASLPCRRSRSSLVVRADKYVRVPSNYRKKEREDDGAQDWFSVTKRAAWSVSKSYEASPLDAKFAERKAKVQRYVDRVDLYEGNWEGDKYVGSRFNVLNVLLLIAVGTPILGLVFAYLTYGTVWG